MSTGREKKYLATESTLLLRKRYPISFSKMSNISNILTTQIQIK